MITLTNLKQLPYKTYSAFVLKDVKDADAIAKDKESYLYIATGPKMILLFVVGIREISNN